MGEPVRIASTDPVPERARALFAPLGHIEVGEAALGSADVLLVRGRRIDRATLDAAPRLRVIARTGAGVDGVDVEAATARGIAVLYAPDAGTVPVAEGAFALILAAAKRLGELGCVVRRGDWHARYDIETTDLRGSVLGVVGFGRIGREVARLAEAFGMRVLAHDPLASPARAGTEFVALDELIARADVITLHCALTDATVGLIGRRALSRMKPGTILVNVARGAIIESGDHLLEALEAGRLAAVGLDVFPEEPPETDHQLLRHPRVVCTPHSVGLTAAWNERVFGTLARDVAALLGGRRPGNLLNPEVLTRSVERLPG